MAVLVLGPLDTGSTAPLSPRERAVLAALIVRSPASMSGAELADAHWGERLPATWAQQVKTSINRIRSRIGSVSIETTTAGYRFAFDPEVVDAVRFERLVADARGQALRGELARAIDTYRRALALWRGSPYPDLADWEPGKAEAARLSSIRASAEEELLEARLGVGEGRTVIPDAERLVREQPMREEPWTLLALANYRADRQAEALAVLRRARRLFDEELGIQPSARLSDLETAILRQDPALSPPPAVTHASETCPYRGLQAFGPQDAESYAGREEDLERVLGRFHAGVLIAIAGPSGSGKSSLMLAGVVPRLRAAGRVVEIVGPAGGAEQLHRAVDLASPSGIVAIDQAEELFFGLSVGETTVLSDAVGHHLKAGGVVVATVRSDFIDPAVALPGIGDAIARDLLILGPLHPDALRAAIEEPARRTGLMVEPGLTELITRDVGTRPAVLPHLSHALVETWRRREGTTLTVAGYTAAGGIAGAIAQSAEQCYNDFDEHQREVARSLLLRLLERGADLVTVRRPAQMGPLVADAGRRAVLEALVAARLVTVAGDAVMVAHEAVATAWPRLDEWLTTDAADALVLRQVGAAAENWEMSGRTDDDLLRGARLQAALEWRSRAGGELTEPEQVFLGASEDRELASQRELVDRAAHDRRQNRRLRWALGAVAVLLATVTAGGGVAVFRAMEASEQARIEALSSTSLALRSSAVDLAALLAVAAYRTWPDDPRARSALSGVATAAGAYLGTTRIPNADVASAALIPGTRRAVVVRDRGEIGADWRTTWKADLAIVDIDTGEELAILPADGLTRNPDYPQRTIEVSANGEVALVQTGALRDNGQCCQNQLDFIDLTTGLLLPGSRMLDSRTSNRHALSEDGRTAYILNAVTADLITVDTWTGKVTWSSTPVSPETTQNAYNPFYGTVIVDQDRIATSGNGEIVVRDRRSLKTLARIAVPDGYATEALSLDHAGGIVGLGAAGIVRVDLRSGAVRWKHALSSPPTLTGIEVDPATEVLYLANVDGVIEEFSLASGEPTGHRLSGFPGAVGMPVVTRPGEELVLVGSQIGDYDSGGKTGFVRWRLDGGGPSSALVAPGRILVGGFDSAGGRVLVAQPPYDPKAGTAVWDVGRRVPVSTAPGNYLAWVAPETVMDWTQFEDVKLLDLASGTTTGLASDPRFGPAPWIDPKVVQGTKHAFAIQRDRIVPIDPATGTVTGPVLGIPQDIFAKSPAGADERLWVSAVSESRDGERLVVTWFADPAIVSETSVFDLATGKELARGLIGTKVTRVTAGGEILGASADQITVSSLDDLAVHRILSRPGGSASDITVSADGGTALIATSDQQAWLYDISTGMRLGDPIASDVADGTPAYLSPDGRSLVVNTSRGVILWDIDPAHLAEAACRLAAREPTPTEWSTYLAYLGPQRPLCR